MPTEGHGSRVFISSITLQHFQSPPSLDSVPYTAVFVVALGINSDLICNKNNLVQ